MRLANSGARIPFVVAWLLASATVHGQSSCDAWYRFDGDLSDASGNGYDGMMIAESGEPAPPQFGAGKFGEALHISDGSAMRSFLDLHYDRCPQFTITAWIKVPSVGFAGPQYIFSTGERGGIPALRINDQTITLYGNANGLSQREAIRDGSSWFFVAATFDYEARVYKLYWRNRHQEGVLSDSPYSPEDSLWVGTRSDKMYGTAQSLYIDDLRISGRVLDLAEIRDVSMNQQVATAESLITDADPLVPVSGGQGPGIEIPDDMRGTELPLGELPDLSGPGADAALPFDDPGQQIADPDSQAVIFGKVSDARGQGVAETMIFVTRAANDQQLTRGRTAADGTYAIAVFASEPVKISFLNTRNFPHAEFEYAGRTWDREEARQIKVSPGEQIEIDAEFQVLDCRIEGTVTHASGLRLPGVQVGLFARDAFDRPRRPAPLHAVTTASNGKFVIDFSTIEDWQKVEEAFALGCIGSSCGEYVSMKLQAIDPTGTYESTTAPQRVYMDTGAYRPLPGNDQCNRSDHAFTME